MPKVNECSEWRELRPESMKLRIGFLRDALTELVQAIDDQRAGKRGQEWVDSRLMLARSVLESHKQDCGREYGPKGYLDCGERQ